MTSRTEHDLEAALRAESEVPVDTDAMLAAVHRSARRRRSARVGGTALAITAAVATAAAVTLPGLRDRPAPTETAGRTAWGCTVAELPLPPEVAGLDANLTANIDPIDIDPSGRRILAAAADRDRGIVIRWDDGVPTVLPVTDAGTYATGMNTHGTVVGFRLDSSPLGATGVPTNDASAWVYADGELRTLPTPAGYDVARAMAINDGGEIAGFAGTFSYGDADEAESVAVVWSADDRTPRVLPAPGGAVALDIAGDGTVVGFADRVWGKPYGQPYVWTPDGTDDRTLGLPTGLTLGAIEQVRGGWALGHGLRAAEAPEKGGGTYRFVTVTWNLRTGEWRASAESDMLIGDAINANGDTARWTEDDGSRLTRDGRDYTLPAPPGVDTVPYLLSDDATVVVGRAFPRTTPVATLVTWRCQG